MSSYRLGGLKSEGVLYFEVDGLFYSRPRRRLKHRVEGVVDAEDSMVMTAKELQESPGSLRVLERFRIRFNESGVSRLSPEISEVQKLIRPEFPSFKIVKGSRQEV